MSFTFKLLFANELRRVTIPQDGSSSSLSFSSFSATVVQLFPSLTPGSFLLRWVDEDNDVITIASDDDLNEGVDYVRKAGREVLKATVIQTTPAPAATPSAPMETEPSAPPAPAQEKQKQQQQQQQQPAPEAQEEPEEPHYRHHRRHHGHHHRHHGHHGPHHHQHGHQQWQREESPPPLPETDEQGRPYHSGVTCDGCNRPLYGIRYKCAECHNFDLCEECEAKGTHPAEHVTLKIRVPTKVELYNPYGGRVPGGGRRECPWFGGFGASWQQHGFAHPWHRGPWQHGAFPPPPPHPHVHQQQQQQQQQQPWGHWGGRSHCRRGWWNKHHEGAGEASSSSSFSSSTSSASASSSSPSASSASTSVSVEPLIQLQQQQSASEEGYEDRLQILSSMGFYDRETNLRLLKEGNGSLEDVITKLTELTF